MFQWWDSYRLGLVSRTPRPCPGERKRWDCKSRWPRREASWDCMGEIYGFLMDSLKIYYGFIMIYINESNECDWTMSYLHKWWWIMGFDPLVVMFVCESSPKFTPWRLHESPWSSWKCLLYHVCHLVQLSFGGATLYEWISKSWLETQGCLLWFVNASHPRHLKRIPQRLSSQENMP